MVGYRTDEGNKGPEAGNRPQEALRKSRCQTQRQRQRRTGGRTERGAGEPTEQGRTVPPGHKGEKTWGEPRAQWGLLCKAPQAQTLRWEASSSIPLPMEQCPDKRSSPCRSLEPSFLRMPQTRGQGLGRRPAGKRMLPSSGIGGWKSLVFHEKPQGTAVKKWAARSLPVWISKMLPSPPLVFFMPERWKERI